MRPLLPREKMILLVLAVLVVGIGFYFMIYSPKINEINKLSVQLKSKQAELKQLQAAAARKPEVEARLRALQREVADTEAKLPTSREIPILLVQLEGLASQVGANLTLIRPGPPQGQSQPPGGQQPPRSGTPSPAQGLGLQQFSLELNAEGTFDTVQSFVRGIETFPRFIAMSDLKITPLPGRPGESPSQPRLSVGVSATTYFVPESGGGR
jgi:Tfp pilus assembly protein PilO